MFSLRRHILMLKFLHSYPCLAMQSVTKCTEMWVFRSKSSYCNHLRLVVYPIIYRILYPRWLFQISEPSTVTCHFVRETRNISTASSRAEATWCELWFLRCVGTPRFNGSKPMGPLDISDIKFEDLRFVLSGKNLGSRKKVANVIPVLAII